MAPAPAVAANPLEAQLRQTPCFHLVSNHGWVNDPNGPLFFNGRYHLFYQNVPDSISWQWGLLWGHATSEDLVHWECLPPALRPTPGTPNEDGCFSGCAVVDEDGTPTLLYTGVRLKSGLPHVTGLTTIGVSLLCEEAQVAAVAEDVEADGGRLLRWKQLDKPWIAAAPEGVPVNCFRDPFILERPCAANGNEWVAMVGSGLTNIGGTALLYRSPRLLDGWRYDGNVCEDGGVQAGYLWECPSISHLTTRGQAPIPALNGHGAPAPLYGPSPCDAGVGTPGAPHLLCVSNGLIPSIFWVGAYSNGRFALKEAQGPFNMDLGRLFYAPNVLVDQQGRLLMWAWLMDGQQNGEVMTPTCSGALTATRMVTWDEGHQVVFQEPLPELTQLRRPGASWVGHDIELQPGQPFILPKVDSAHLDMEIEFELDAPTAAQRLGAGGAGWVCALAVVVRSTTEPAMAPASALMYHFDSRVLEMLQELPVGPRALGVTDVVLTQAAASKATLRAGGQLHAPLKPKASSSAAAAPSVVSPLSSQVPAGTGVCGVCGGETTHGHGVSGRQAETAGEVAADVARSGSSGANNGNAPNGAGGNGSDGNGTITAHGTGPALGDLDGNGHAHAYGGQAAVPAAGAVPALPSTLTLRLLLDGSILETFTSTGQVLTSRVYREHSVGAPLSSTAPGCGSVLSHHVQDNHHASNGHGAPFACGTKYGVKNDPMDYKDCGIEIIALGCPLRIKRVEAHEMGSMWVTPRGPCLAPSLEKELAAAHV